MVCLLIVRKKKRPRGTHFSMLLENKWRQLFKDIKDTWCNMDIFNANYLINSKAYDNYANPQITS